MTKLTIYSSAGNKESGGMVYEDKPISQRMLTGLLGANREDLELAAKNKGVSAVVDNDKKFYALEQIPVLIEGLRWLSPESERPWLHGFDTNAESLKISLPDGSEIVVEK